jgi:hypothetical protein
MSRVKHLDFEVQDLNSFSGLSEFDAVIFAWFGIGPYGAISRAIGNPILDNVWYSQGLFPPA